MRDYINFSEGFTAKKHSRVVSEYPFMHLCANVLLSNTIPAGTKMRRKFSFWPGEKSTLNRAYRMLVDRWLARRSRLVDYFLT
jgi:hypothetical protein